MKYGLILLLLALAAVEYFHHRADGHTHGGVVTSDADDQQAKRLEMGQRVPCALHRASDWAHSLFRIYRSQALPQNFIGTADWRSGVLHPRRFIAQRLANQN